MSGRDDLGEWLAYLNEIGVREIEAPEQARAGSRAVPPSPRGALRETAPAKSSGVRPRATPSKPSRAPRAPASVGVSPRSEPSRAAGPAGGGLFGSGFETPPPEDPARRLGEIREELGDCTRCKLHEGRTNVVFGVGSPRAALMFIGEGPGADEDLKGEPFVGRAGKKLDEMIAAIGLTREKVYIANVVKCRPPQNRDPERDEIETCSPFLIRQIETIRPRVIVTLGSPATRTVLATRVGITKLRGTWHEFHGIPVMPTFHPAYLLRAYTPENRRRVWDDLKAARARIDEG